MSGWSVQQYASIGLDLYMGRRLHVRAVDVLRELPTETVDNTVNK